jgi:hypothetical protein
LISFGGAPFPAELAEHVRTCSACQAMVSAPLNGGDGEVMDTAVSAEIRGAIARDTKPVRPLPGTTAMGATFFLLCWVIAMAGGIIAGPNGFHLLTQSERISIFGVLLAVTAGLAILAARGMRPAAGRLFGGWPAVLSLLALEMVFLAVFQDYDTGDFIHAGLVCLGLGSAFAIPVTCLTWLVMNRGFVVERVTAGMLAVLVGGLAGLGMLELHCPLLTMPHVGFWHVAVVMVSLVFGACLGSRDNRSSNAAA